MLLSEDLERRWVGTNNLRLDPRQSLAHTQHWSEATGDAINDYWVFPVFLDGSLYGAFRVFNRLPARWYNGIPWPEAMLWELREVADWCGGALLPRLAAGVRTRKVTETVHSSAVQHLKSHLGLEWIDDDFLVMLVTHLTTVVHRVVEAKSLGCCIGVFANPGAVVGHTASYHAAGAVAFSSDSAHPLEDAAAAYHAINPASGIFVFDGDGVGHAVRQIGLGESLGLQAMEQLSSEHRDGVIFLLDRGQDCVLVIAHGRVVADYYLSPRNGEWVLRVYEELADRCMARKPSRVPAEDVRDVLGRAMDLSYARVGALLILGDDIPPNTYFEYETVLDSVNLLSIKPWEFIDMAGLDGAVHIKPRGRVVAVGALVRTSNGTSRHRGGVEGSRHSSAAAFSAAAPEHMVVVVSENRSISVLVHGEFVVERM